MSNLIKIENTSESVIKVHPYKRTDGRTVYVNKETSVVYYTQTSFAEFTGVSRQALAARLTTAKKSPNFDPLEGRMVDGSQVSQCKLYSVSQVTEYCKIYAQEKLVYGGESYLLNAKELHEIGFIQTSISPEQQKPQTLTLAESVIAMLPYTELAAKNPGLDQLATGVNTIPCLIISEKPFTLRFWTQIHFAGFNLSKQSLTRFGRQVAATYQQLKLELPTNGYTPTTNKYTRADHELICQVFQTMLDHGQLES
jgi:hypothetical protein